MTLLPNTRLELTVIHAPRRSIARLGGRFRSRLPDSVHVESREHVDQVERNLSKRGYNRTYRMNLNLSMVQFDDSRGTFVCTELRT